MPRPGTRPPVLGAPRPRNGLPGPRRLCSCPSFSPRTVPAVPALSPHKPKCRGSPPQPPEPACPVAPRLLTQRPLHAPLARPWVCALGQTLCPPAHLLCQRRPPWGALGAHALPPAAQPFGPGGATEPTHVQVYPERRGGQKAWLCGFPF